MAIENWNSYRQGFVALPGPALLAMLVLTSAARLHPKPQRLEAKGPGPAPSGLNRPYWYFTPAAALGLFLQTPTSEVQRST